MAGCGCGPLADAVIEVGRVVQSIAFEIVFRYQVGPGHLVRLPIAHAAADDTESYVVVARSKPGLELMVSKARTPIFSKRWVSWLCHKQR